MSGIMNFDKTNSEFLHQQMQGFNLTKALVNQELTGLFNSETLRDMNHVMEMYKVYLQGADFTTDQSSNDWSPAQWHARQIKSLIDKEARFLFSEPPDIKLKDVKAQSSDNTRIDPNEQLLNRVLKRNHFNSKLVRGAKDCLIGKRIAIAVNFNETTGIDISFIPSLEFIYETDPADVDIITKFIQYYNITVNNEKSQQRIYKKKWYMKDGYCRVVEAIYDGNANLIEEVVPDTTTRFTYIPVAIIINDGLSGDPFGISEVESLEDTESWYSKLSNKDIDSLRKGTDQITYAVDAAPNTTKGLSRAPGSFWDIATDPASDGRSAQIGTLDNPMSYSPALGTTLQRLRADMHDQLDVPDISNEAMQGIITSGKTMQAIYWGLMVRCNEKMLDWGPAFQQMAEIILEGAQLYPEIAERYVSEPIVDGYSVEVENSYPILQDETEEKSADILEVNAKVRSRKSYMKKWLGLTDSDVDAELQQIVLEMSLLEQENYTPEPLETSEGEE